jgi:hypothetical protein
MSQVLTNNFRPLAGMSCGVPSEHRERHTVQRSLVAGVAEALDLDVRGRGIHSLAAAIRDKLASGEGGSEAAASMLQSIDEALEAAGAKLAERGVSQEQIDAGIARFRARLSRELNELAPAEVEKTAIAAREVVREKYSLDILTAEGDKVSIRFKSVNVTEVAAAQVTREGQTATAVEANVISRGRFKVEVDGDLNDAERAAIGDLLDKVDGIANDFFGGDVQAAFAAASRVGLESDALSAFSLKLSYSRSLAMASYSNTARLGSEPAPAPSVPAPAPSSPDPVQAAQTSGVVASNTTPVVESTAAEPAPATTPAPAPGTPAPAPGTPAPAPGTPAPDSGSASKTIGSFVKDVLARLSSVGETEYARFSMRWKVDFLMTAISSAATTPAEQAATGALGEALNSQPAVAS